MGIALGLYSEARFEEIESGLEINILDSSREFLPCDESNYVYRAMERVFDKAGKRPKGIRITSNTDILAYAKNQEFHSLEVNGVDIA